MVFNLFKKSSKGVGQCDSQEALLENQGLAPYYLGLKVPMSKNQNFQNMVSHQAFGIYSQEPVKELGGLDHTFTW